MKKIISIAIFTFFLFSKGIAQAYPDTVHVAKMICFTKVNQILKQYDKGWQIELEIPEITESVFTKGAVLVYIRDNVGHNPYQAIPLSSNGRTYEFSYTYTPKGLVTIATNHKDTNQDIKVVLIY